MFRSFYFLNGLISVARSPRAIRQVKRKKAYCPVYPRTAMIEFYRLCLPLAGHQYMELVLRKIARCDVVSRGAPHRLHHWPQRPQGPLCRHGLGVGRSVVYIV